MFHCRGKELDIMEKRYRNRDFECIVIYGRRRVGKTALINEFCKDKPTIYFSALNANSRENLEALSREIHLYTNLKGAGAPVYSNYDDALQAITELAEKERLVFVIDEYPYLAKAEVSISSRLQHMIDRSWQHGQLYLILCGSSMSFMEYQVLGYESPLYGRRTAQFKIEHLDYRETRAFHPQLSKEDQALLYGITGGIPQYINKLGVVDDMDEALIDNFFESSAYLFEEPENLLKQELREPAMYNSIISAIAEGATRSNEISTRVGVESGICAKYLRVLLQLGILKKESPFLEKSKKKQIYVIDDNFFRFWYKFVPRNMSIISSGNIRKFYDRAIKQYYPEYMGLIFEKMCREFLLKYTNNLPIDLCDVGQWWGPDKERKKQVQIDIIGSSVEGDGYIIGSCKYRNDPVDVDEFEKIVNDGKAFGKDGKYHYYIFSKSGFTNALVEKEKEGLVNLVALEDM